VKHRWRRIISISSECETFQSDSTGPEPLGQLTGVGAIPSAPAPPSPGAQMTLPVGHNCRQRPPREPASLARLTSAVLKLLV
jgi:hypothetical protein